MSERTGIDFTLTVNEIAAAHPGTVAVFNRFGLDLCCGGGVNVEQAARRDGLDYDEVRRDLLRAVEAE